MGDNNVTKATKAAIKECPREIFNFYLIACVCIWGFSGVAKGFDEGNIASIVVMPSFKNMFALDHLSEKAYADANGWIVAIATAGANKRTEALSTLVKLRRLPANHPYVKTEFANMEHQLGLEFKVKSGSSFFDLVRETFGNVENRRRFFIMFFCHIFAKWSGANGITQYSPTILGHLGISNTIAQPTCQTC